MEHCYLEMGKFTLIFPLISFIENIHAMATGHMDRDVKEEYCMAAYCTNDQLILSKESCSIVYKVICGNLLDY